MNIREAVKNIKDRFSVEYSDYLSVMPGNILIVSIVFKDYKTLEHFNFSWASAIREQSDCNFSISSKYMLDNGEVKSEMACYRPHNAKRGTEQESSFGKQRINEEE